MHLRIHAIVYYTLSETRAYNLRNQTEYNNPLTWLQLYRNSFFLIRSNFGTI
jgi:hypothetical protein